MSSKDTYSPIIFPRAFAFAVDDLGWNEGSNLSIHNPPGPHRAGVKRTFDLDDYKWIREVGKTIGARIQCLFILSEMDRENILAKYPTTTYQREKWDNSSRVNDSQLQIMRYVREQAANIEFGFHGTGHEYWAADGIQRRAEWYNLTDRHPWPQESLRQHIDCFRKILAQYGLTRENGHSFPESFVPCAYSYYWNPQGNYSLGKLLSEAGVKFANTDFGQIPELSPPQEVNGGGFDHGVHVINRMNYGNHWYELSSLPKVPVALQGTDIIESHWPNWLAQDDFLQPMVTENWINYYRSIQQMPDRYIAKNTEQLHSQWLYKKHTIVKQTGSGTVEIDNTKMPPDAYKSKMLGNLVLKLNLGSNLHISSATIDESLVPSYFEDAGFGFFYLPPLERKKYTLKYSTGTEAAPLSVVNDGTYNVYQLRKQEKEIIVDIRMYGRQTIKIRCEKPEKVVATTGLLVADGYPYDAQSKIVSLIVESTDFQGKSGQLRLLY